MNKNSMDNVSVVMIGFKNFEKFLDKKNNGKENKPPLHSNNIIHNANNNSSKPHSNISSKERGYISSRG
jgi:hypothetical protein